MGATLWAICGTAIAGLLTLVVAWLKSSQAQSTGAQLQAGAAAGQAAKTEQNIAQAVTDAPKTQQAVIDRLKAGTF